MKKTYDKNGNQIILLEQNDIVIKKKEFKSGTITSRMNILGSLDSLGINLEKMIGGFHVNFISTPYYDDFIFSIHVKYGSELVFTTDKIQDYQFAIYWAEIA